MSAARQQQRVTLNHLLPGMSLADGDLAIDGVALDSRSVTPGDLFLAVAGEVHDGRQFIEQAVANGANAVVAEAPVSGFVDDVSVPLVELPELHLEVGLIAARFFAHPSESLPVIGVTGTNGKTTTTCLLAQMMRLLGRQAGVIGTLGVSLDGTVQSAINTTPDPVSLQGQFAAWREKGVDIVGMEVSSHALVQGRVNGVCFDTAVFTNLSQDHLDYHGTMESYGKAKLRLFNVQGLKHAVVNLDDAFSEQVLASIPGEVNVVTYSVVQEIGRAHV